MLNNVENGPRKVEKGPCNVEKGGGVGGGGEQPKKGNLRGGPKRFGATKKRKCEPPN